MIRIRTAGGFYVHAIHAGTRSLSKTHPEFPARAKDFKSTESAQKWLDKNLPRCKELKGSEVVEITG